MKEYVLTVDVGNTSTALGLYANEKIHYRMRIDTAGLTHESCSAVLCDLIGEYPLCGAVIGSVVPEATPVWKKSIQDGWGQRILVVSHKVKLWVSISYPAPETIGADRLANACGAVCKYGAPVIVADFGTALTFDVVSAKGAYVGGVITPGLPLMFDYLAEKTALLPHVQPGSPKHTVGKTTEEAIQIGTHWGYMGMVREILARIRKKYGGAHMKVCATGGYASWVLRGLGQDVTVDPDLTLYGLGRIYDVNQQ